MTWVKLDDKFPEHPKVLAVGGWGAWLHVQAIAYCNRNLTDGFVPFGALETMKANGVTFEDEVGACWGLGATSGMSGRETSEFDWPQMMIDAGLWEPAKGGIRVHDYHDYNPTKAEVLAERSKVQNRVQNWREKRRNAKGNGVTRSDGNGGGNGVTEESECNAVGNGGVTPAPVPVPVPVLRPSLRDNGEAKTSGSPAASRPARVPFIPPTPDEVRTFAAEKGLTLDPEYFVDAYALKGWMAGKVQVRDWKAAARNAARDGWTMRGRNGGKPDTPRVVIHKNQGDVDREREGDEIARNRAAATRDREEREFAEGGFLPPDTPEERAESERLLKIREAQLAQEAQLAGEKKP